jgi:heavy metal sensor kinase
MKIRRSRSLAFQLTVWYVALLGVIVAVSGVVLYEGYRESRLADLDRGLRRIAGAAEEAWRPRGIGWDQALQRAEEQFKTREPWLMAVQLPEKGTAARTAYTFGPRAVAAFVLGGDVYAQAEERNEDHPLFLTVDDRRLAPDPMRIVLLPLRGRILIQAAVSQAGARDDLRRLAFLMGLAGFLLLVMASAGGNFILRRALRPVRDVVGAARRISADDLGHRLDAPNRGGEIGALVETFNAMLDRLKRSVGRIRQFSGDVSHELRTPLTAIRGEVEVLRRKDRTREEVERTLDSVLEETSRMGTIIDDLLFLSRLEASRRAPLAGIAALDEVAVETFESRESAARTKGLVYLLAEAVPVKVRGDRTLLERMIANIIDNAIRYTPAGGTIRLSVAIEDENGVLTVSDTGIGIAEADQPHIFDRFYVADPSRSRASGGSGLGLSIVKEVADLHEAFIVLRSRVGEGTTFAVRFHRAE